MNGVYNQMMESRESKDLFYYLKMELNMKVNGKLKYFSPIIKRFYV